MKNITEFARYHRFRLECDKINKQVLFYVKLIEMDLVKQNGKIKFYMAEGMTKHLVEIGKYESLDFIVHNTNGSGDDIDSFSFTMKPTGIIIKHNYTWTGMSIGVLKFDITG